MDGTFVSTLVDKTAQPQMVGNVLAVPNGWTANDPLAFVEPGPTATALKVYSLTAVRDYLAANRDGLPRETLIVHVVSPQIVRVLGPIREHARDREAFVEANADNLTDNFLGKWLPHDEFVIGLQTRFEAKADLAAVLKLVGNISGEQVRTSADDGITQSVTARAGIALKQDAIVPNPVTLVPFRTFREVEQPSSLFALRVNGTMQVGLFEADGGAWRLRAINDIATWLRAALPETVAVLA